MRRVHVCLFQPKGARDGAAPLLRGVCGRYSNGPALHLRTEPGERLRASLHQWTCSGLSVGLNRPLIGMENCSVSSCDLGCLSSAAAAETANSGADEGGQLRSERLGADADASAAGLPLDTVSFSVEVQSLCKRLAELVLCLGAHMRQIKPCHSLLALCRLRLPASSSPNWASNHRRRQNCPSVQGQELVLPCCAASLAPVDAAAGAWSCRACGRQYVALPPPPADGAGDDVGPPLPRCVTCGLQLARIVPSRLLSTVGA